MISEVTAEISKLYTDRIVTALVGIETDVSRVENVSVELAKEGYVEDVFIVTGDYDIVVKVKCPDFNEFQEFLVGRLTKIPGIKSSKTMMVISIKKEMGKRVEE
ncbi:hypothetical protein GCM10007108_10980 [Thermogymnomonas acidicola]|uniref:Transcription regulator AsnC/Lrp ligand binding domain-containing protein n=1 Tax=Thermogymnomonas acidicola TaxID=399579 RepID=A0AA37BRS5_9ARCH|nr:Lrp/AsnC ligand binding domain-containing protein [Thermogymnomonas acidicola]GGM74798.1 hypothetical protein GCM10007108_10980 [Thermogymnomonas acidicola]